MYLSDWLYVNSRWCECWIIFGSLLNFVGCLLKASQLLETFIIIVSHALEELNVDEE
jgi:hypothetical protein